MVSPLLTDLYQLTMAQGYWRAGTAADEAVFHLSFRSQPFGGGYSVAAGLADVVEFVRSFRFAPDELTWLRSLRGDDGTALFEGSFLEMLASLELAVDVDAVEEGTVVFPHIPLVRVRGPILPCQLLETTLLNIVNFQTLIATKAARIRQAAAHRTVLEFGLRRAHGPDGGLSATRAAYIGGCDATSNVLGAFRFGLEPRGTHAHSWVMSFDDEQTAFDAWADAMPNNVTLLVDTYDTLEGVRHAVQTGKRLQQTGHQLAGIRLDSGDLAYLSIEARKLLDEAGLQRTKIVASNDLDEHLIETLIAQGAQIDIFGVGTKLVTAWDQPALGGVYKLGAMRRRGGEWERKIKVSEQAVKTTIPGILQVRRHTADGVDRNDVIFDELDGVPDPREQVVDPADVTRTRLVPQHGTHRDLLVPVFRGGRCVYDVPPLRIVRERAAAGVAALHPAIRRLSYPHVYPVALERRLAERRLSMIRDARSRKESR